MVVVDALGREFKDFAALERQVLLDAQNSETTTSTIISEENQEILDNPDTVSPAPTTTIPAEETEEERGLLPAQPAPSSPSPAPTQPRTTVDQAARDLPPPPTAEALRQALADAAPFIQDGRLALDTAMDRGISLRTLRVLGVSDKDISDALARQGGRDEGKEEKRVKIKALSDIEAAGARFVISRDLIDDQGRIDTIRALRSGVTPATLRKAGLSSKQVDASVKLNKELTALEAIKVAEPEGIGPRFVKDTMSELLTFGKVETESFNPVDLKRRYREAKAALSSEYDRVEAEATADGQRLITSKNDFILQNIGTEKAFVAAVLSAQPALSSIAKEFGLASIPIYGTFRTWNESPHWARGLRAASDLLFIVPIVGQVGVAARTGATFASTARTLAVSTVTGVPRAIRHPLRAVKGTTEPFVDALNPNLLPTGGLLEVRTSTIRLPALKGYQVSPGDIKVPASTLQGLDAETGLVGAGGRVRSTISTADLRGIPQEPAILQSMEWRDQVTRQAIEGKPANAPLPFGEGALLTPTIQRRIGPAAIHSTPDLRPYFNGLTVGEGGTSEVYFAPGVMTEFVLKNASGKMPKLSAKVREAVALGQMSKNPVPGSLLIRDPELLAELAASNKLWKGTAEIELVLKPGVRIPPPSQFLFYRDAAGRKVTLAVVGEPLTRAEIAKLKLVGAADSVKTIFSRPGRVRVNETTRAVKAADETVDLLNRAAAAEARGSVREARVLRQRAAASSKRAEDALDAAQRSAAENLSKQVDPIAVYTGSQNIDAALKVLGKGSPKTTSNALTKARASGGIVSPEERILAARGTGTLGEVGGQISTRLRPGTTAARSGPSAKPIARPSTKVGSDDRRSVDVAAARPDGGLPPRGPGGRFVPERPGGGSPRQDGGTGVPDRPSVDIPGRSDIDIPGRDDIDIPRGGDDIDIPGRTDIDIPGRDDIDIPRGGDDIDIPGRTDIDIPRDGGGRPPIPPRGFILPGGKRLKAGFFPHVIQVPQGKTMFTGNLITGKVTWQPRKPDGTTPEEGFKVLRMGKERPPPRLLEMGIVDVDLDRKGLFFRARPKRRKPSISRRLIRRG